MIKSETTPLAAQDIIEIEQRAHALRSQAMAQILRAAGTALATAATKLARVLHRPRHA